MATQLERRILIWQLAICSAICLLLSCAVVRTCSIFARASASSMALHSSRAAALRRQDLSRTCLAHHELESKCTIIIILVIIILIIILTRLVPPAGHNE